MYDSWSFEPCFITGFTKHSSSNPSQPHNGSRYHWAKFLFAAQHWIFVTWLFVPFHSGPSCLRAVDQNSWRGGHQAFPQGVLQKLFWLLCCSEHQFKPAAGLIPPGWLMSLSAVLLHVSTAVRLYQSSVVEKGVNGGRALLWIYCLPMFDRLKPKNRMKKYQVKVLS